MSQHENGDSLAIPSLVGWGEKALEDKVDALMGEERKLVYATRENTLALGRLRADTIATVEGLRADLVVEFAKIHTRLDGGNAVRAKLDSLAEEHDADVTLTRKAIDVLEKTDVELHAQVAAARQAAAIKIGVLVPVVVALWETGKWALPLLAKLFH